METEGLLNIQQVATYLRVSTGTLYHWLSQRRGPPPIRFSSRCLRWRLSDVEAWVEEKVNASQDSDFFRSKSGRRESKSKVG